MHTRSRKNGSESPLVCREPKITCLDKCSSLSSIDIPPVMSECGTVDFDSDSSPFYYSINCIRPCQGNVSCLNIKKKYNSVLKKGHAVWDCHKFILSFDNGRAVYPLEKAFPVINSPYGFILINGTHRTVTSIKFGSTRIPIKILKDFSTMSKDQFLEIAVGKYIFPYDLSGNQTISLPCKFTELIDNPNRYFAIISSRNCKTPGTPNNKTTGHDYPLWIKIGDQTGRLENMIAETLHAAGLTYKNEYGDKIPEWFIEAARNILIDNPIPGLCLITNRTYYNDIPNICSSC